MKPRLVYVLAFALIAGGAAVPALHARLDAQQPAAAPAPQAPRPIDIDDIAPWKGIGASSISNDGQWLAYMTRIGESGLIELSITRIAEPSEPADERTPWPPRPR